MCKASYFLLLLIIASTMSLSLACFASGICGGGCPPPPPPVCGGGCGVGYSCGHYGCYRTRARAASSLTITYTRAALQAMYFKQDSCPIQAATDIHYCAAQGKDHRDCCARNGVATTLAGHKVSFSLLNTSANLLLRFFFLKK
uniref:DB domain-containing protein n=1 Tax=Angiostrongylus cantonensis TaxID=6313 RepID=A0A0K0D4A4_ANGCA